MITAPNHQVIKTEFMEVEDDKGIVHIGRVMSMRDNGDVVIKLLDTGMILVFKPTLLNFVKMADEFRRR